LGRDGRVYNSLLQFLCECKGKELLKTIHICRSYSKNYRKRGIAQRDGRTPLLYRRWTSVVTCKNLVTMATGVVLEWYHYIVRPLKPPLWYRNLALVSYTRRVIAKFYVQIANFSLPWQQRSVEANLNDTMKLADLEKPIVYKNPGHRHRLYTGWVIANFVFEYPNLLWSHFTDSRSPLVQVLLLTSLVNVASECHCYTLLF